MDIETNIPLPTELERDRWAAQVRYPYRHMKVGDSFLHPGGPTPRTAYLAAWMVMRRAKDRTGHDFVMMKEGTGYRIWRRA